MRSSNFRNSAVSSSIVFEGRFWKGITSDKAEPPLAGTTALQGAFCRQLPQLCGVAGSEFAIMSPRPMTAKKYKNCMIFPVPSGTARLASEGLGSTRRDVFRSDNDEEPDDPVDGGGAGRL